MLKNISSKNIIFGGIAGYFFLDFKETSNNKKINDQNNNLNQNNINFDILILI